MYPAARRTRRLKKATLARGGLRDTLLQVRRQVHMPPIRSELDDRLRLSLWFGTCALALLITSLGYGGLRLIGAIPWFASGLLYTLTPQGKQLAGDHYFVLTWFVYGALTLAAAFTRRRIAYFILYAILVLLLVLNVAGCRSMLTEFHTRGISPH